MTAPSPEEFAKRVFPTKIRVGQCAIDCATVEETDEMQSRLNAAAAALLAPLREEVERLRGALRPFAAIQPTPTMPDGDKFVIVWDGSLLWADVDPKIAGAWSGVTAADLRAAARALAEGQP